MSPILHAWSVLCEKVITDSTTNNVSLDVIERISIVGLPEIPAGSKGFVVPIRLSLVSLWYRADSEVGGKCDARIRILSPEGSELTAMAIVVDLTSAPRARAIGNLTLLPVSRSGIYMFVVEQKTPKEGWVDIARLPLEVVLAQGEPATGPVPSTP